MARTARTSAGKDAIRRAVVALILLAALVGMAVAFGARPASAADFTVTNTNDSGAGSLRQAITDANASPGADTIVFAIPASDPGCIGGVCKILPTSSLPNITEAVTINGYTQPGARANTLANGSNAVLKIELSGANVPQNTSPVGLQTFASGSVVKGLIINRWGFYGLGIIGANVRNSRIEGNFIGTDHTGTQRLANDIGVVLQGSSNTVGGTTPASRNVISGNTFAGVFLNNSGVVRGNLIGTTKSGTGALENGMGVAIFGSGNTVGARNVIAFNGVGVRVQDGSTGNRILSNSIHSNALLGIDLGEDGVTPNDPRDPDTGSNNLQNFPVLSSAITRSGKTTIRSRLNSTPNRSFTVQFFSNPTADPSGFGEGKTLLGQKVVRTDARGNASFVFRPARALPAGRKITATATDSAGNTSEFSRAKGVVRRR